MAEEGRPPVDIRTREIRDGDFETQAVVSRFTSYEAGGGREIFVERTTPDDRVLGFLRLSLPTASSCLRELEGAALIRELHVYGAALPLGAEASGPRDAQHRGLGAGLLAEAAGRAAAAGFERLAVVSAVGTRTYYRRHGFCDGRLYQHRAWPETRAWRRPSAGSREAQRTRGLTARCGSHHAGRGESRSRSEQALERVLDPAGQEPADAQLGSVEILVEPAAARPSTHCTPVRLRGTRSRAGGSHCRR